MDDPGGIILDISSDDEVGWGECRVTCSGGGVTVRDDGDWISEILNEVDKHSDDSDEVVVIREVIANPKQRVVKCAAKKCVVDEDDDECVILDGDPEKPVTVENEGGDNSDDLLVVSEKGQVACRDYPHSRHLCVKFPFNSTPHERHCEQCHCYVCDSLAPCVCWGNGGSSIDHCHATDKDIFWKSQRKSSKSDKPPPLVSRVPDNSSAIGLTPLNQTPSLLDNSLRQDPGLLTQAAHQLCSITTSIGTPTLVRCGRNQHFRYHRRNKLQPHSVSQKPRCTNENFVPRIRKHGVPSFGTRSASQRDSFKRTGTVGGVLATNSFSNNSYRNNDGYQYGTGNQSLLSEWQDPQAKVIPMSNTYHGSQQVHLCGTATDSTTNLSTRPSMGSGLVYHTASQTQISSQTYRNSLHELVPQPQVSSQIHLGSNLANLIPPLPGVGTQQKRGNPFANGVPFQSQASLLVDPRSQNPVHSQPLVTSCGNINNSSECPLPFQPLVSFQDPFPCQFQVCGQPASPSHDGQNRFKQGNHAQSAPPSRSADFGSNLCTSMSQTNQPLLIEQTHLQSAILRDKPAVTGDSQLPQSSNPAESDFQFDTWTFDDVSALKVLDIPLPPGLDAHSSESALVDDVLLFDF